MSQAVIPARAGIQSSAVAMEQELVPLPSREWRRGCRIHAFGFEAFGFVSVRLNWNLTLISLADKGRDLSLVRMTLK